MFRGKFVSNYKISNVNGQGLSWRGGYLWFLRGYPPPRKSILDKILFTPLYNILINRLVKHQKQKNKSLMILRNTKGKFWQEMNRKNIDMECLL